MMLLKSFFRRIIKDFWQKELMPLKLIFFVQTSTLYVLYQYLTIHMRELGISVEETAIMSAITPFVAIIMPPVAGLIADRIGNFKILLSLFSALGGAAALLLLLVPVARVTVQFPSSVVFSGDCQSGELVYAMGLQHPCDTLLEATVPTTLQTCGYACPVNALNDTDLKEALKSNYYDTIVRDLETNSTSEFNHPIKEINMLEKLTQQDPRVIRKLQNMESYETAIRQLSKNVMFFPSSVGFTCSHENYTGEEAEWSGTVCQLRSFLPTNKKEFRMRLKAMEQSEEDEAELRRRYFASDATSCAVEQEEVEVRLGQILISGCKSSCLFTAPRPKICTNDRMQIEYNVSLTFWSYLAIRVFIGMIGGTAFAMFEGAVIAILREQKADYGLQRIYGSIGGMISSPLSGMLIDYASGDKGYADFRPAFYLYATLKIFSGVLMLMINLEFKVPATNVVSDVVLVLKNIEVVALLTACFILGTAWGYIESFLFWLLEDLGASRSLMGITVTVGGVAGIPLLVLSGPIIHRIGHANVIFIGFIFYAIRLLGYSLIYNPWLCLIFEALESVTSSLSFTAAVTYAAKLSTTTTDSSIQGLLGGLYYGVGKGCGSLIGGYLMKAFGTRPTYQIFAVVTLLTGLLYLMFNLMYLSKRPQVEGNEIVKKKPKVKPPSALENGDLEASKANKEKEIGIINEPYIIDDIEAINNAKNLDIMEIANAEESEEQENKDKDSNNQLRLRHVNGSVNPAFESDDPAKVTVEKEPSSKK